MLPRKPALPEHRSAAEITGRVVTAHHPNEAWLVDLTAVPTSFGLWCSWFPFAVSQHWPLCWWIAVAVDFYAQYLVT